MAANEEDGGGRREPSEIVEHAIEDAIEGAITRMFGDLEPEPAAEEPEPSSPAEEPEPSSPAEEPEPSSPPAVIAPLEPVPEAPQEVLDAEDASKVLEAEDAGLEVVEESAAEEDAAREDSAPDIPRAAPRGLERRPGGDSSRMAIYLMFAGLLVVLVIVTAFATASLLEDSGVPPASRSAPPPASESESLSRPAPAPRAEPTAGATPEAPAASDRPAPPEPESRAFRAPEPEPEPPASDRPASPDEEREPGAAQPAIAAEGRAEPGEESGEEGEDGERGEEGAAEEEDDDEETTLEPYRGPETAVPDDDECGEAVCLVEPHLACCKDRTGDPPGDAGETGPGGSRSEEKAGRPDRLSREEIERKLRSVRGRVESCGDRHSARGTIHVRVRIAPSGEVARASADGGDVHFRRCAEAAVRQLTFTATRSGGSVRYPYVLR